MRSKIILTIMVAKFTQSIPKTVYCPASVVLLNWITNGVSCFLPRYTFFTMACLVIWSQMSWENRVPVWHYLHHHSETSIVLPSIVLLQLSLTLSSPAPPHRRKQKQIWTNIWVCCAHLMVLNTRSRGRSWRGGHTKGALHIFNEAIRFKYFLLNAIIQHKTWVRGQQIVRNGCYDGGDDAEAFKWHVTAYTSTNNRPCGESD